MVLCFQLVLQYPQLCITVMFSCRYHRRIHYRSRISLLGFLCCEKTKGVKLLVHRRGGGGALLRVDRQPPEVRQRGTDAVFHAKKAQQSLVGAEQGTGAALGEAGTDDRCRTAGAAPDGRAQLPHRQGCGSCAEGRAGVDEVQVFML